MLTIPLYVILSTLQSQTLSGLQKKANHPSHWEFQIFCQDFSSFGGKSLHDCLDSPSSIASYLHSSRGDEEFDRGA